MAPDLEIGRVRIPGARLRIALKLLRAVLVVLAADVFDQFFARREFPGHVEIPWLCKRSRVFNGDVKYQASKIRTAIAFDDMQLFGVRKTVSEPALVVEPNRVHDEGVSFPASDGVSFPGRIEILWMLSSVYEYLPVCRLIFSQLRCTAKSA